MGKTFFISEEVKETFAGLVDGGLSELVDKVGDVEHYTAKMGKWGDIDVFVVGSLMEGQ